MNRSVIRVSLLGVFVCLCVQTLSMGGTFLDNFDRGDSLIVGNGWIETESAPDRMNVEIKDSRVSFERVGAPAVTTTATISHALTGANIVSCDLTFADANNALASGANMAMWIEDSTGNYVLVIIRNDSTSAAQKFTVTYNGGSSVWAQVDGTGRLHNYEFRIAADGKTRLYVDKAEKWSSDGSGLGLITNTAISATRDWEWVHFYADNFKAYAPLPSSAIKFQDDFFRADSEEIGNGWTAVLDTDYIKPVIANNAVAWQGWNGNANHVSAIISPTYPAAGNISVDMMWATANGNANGYLCFTVLDAVDNYLQVKLSPESATQPGWEPADISVNGVLKYSGLIYNYGVYHNYKVRISDSGTVRVYYDNDLKWESADGTMGLSTYAQLEAKRWWGWHQFYADNFIAAQAGPTNCYEVWSDGLGMPTDLNHDCKTNFADFALFASQWLICNNPGGTNCVVTW